MTGDQQAPTDRHEPRDRPLRVLHLATVPFRPEEGVSRAVTELAANLQFVDSHLVADRPVGAGFADLHRVSQWKPGRLLATRALRSVVNDVKPDVVHIHGGILVSILALSPSLRRQPVVATIYQLLPVPRRELGIRQIFDARRSSLRPTRIVASGLFGAPLVRRLLRSGRIEAVCTPDPRVAAVLHGRGPVIIAQGGANPSAHRADWSNVPTVGFAGRAEPGRGVEELIEATALLRREIPGLRLRLLLLPGPAAQRWEQTYGSDPYIDLTVGVCNDLQAKLAECQVVALPFRIPATITPPLVASEAMSVGAPVVANALSCITPMLRSGVNGMLAADSSATALADALREVLSDEVTWRRLSQGARRTIEKDWSWAGAAFATSEAYAVALRRRRRRDDPAVTSRQIDQVADRATHGDQRTTASTSPNPAAARQTSGAASPLAPTSPLAPAVHRMSAKSATSPVSVKSALSDGTRQRTPRL